MSTRDSQTPTEALVREIYEIGPMKRDMWRRAGFDLAQRIAVLALVRRRGPLRVSDVAEDLHVDISVASRHLAALEEEGRVERASDPADGRSRLLAVTAAGEKALAGAHGRMVEAFAPSVEGWSDEDLGLLVGLLRRLRADYARAAREDPVEATAR